MTLSDLSIRRPVFAWMLMSALMFFGVICFFQLGVSQLPEATQPVLTITANWTGAAPEVMETEIVNPIEQAVISVEGVQDIESNMRQSTATIKLTFHTDKDIDAALQETNSKLRSVKLPSDVLPPTISKINTDDNPIMWLAVTSTKRSFKDIVTYVDLNLHDRLRVIPGVGDIVFGGWRDRNLRVWVDNNKLLANQLTILDIRNTLRMENNETTSGYLENGVNDANVRTMGEALTAQQLGDLLITQRGGQRIYHSNIHLRDVAMIEDDLADMRSIARSDGKVTLGVGIQKQHGENDVKVGAAVRAFVDEVNRELAVTDPDMRMVVNFDGTRFTSQAIDETELTVLLSVVVTGLVCWAFLGSWTSTFNVLLSIPTSALGTFIVMRMLGFTINFFTLLGMSLAIGIVVDDAIMVLENIVRHFHMGKTARQAALDGAREITFAATAATISVIAVFIPVLLVGGFIGVFLFQFGMTISTAVGLSLLEAITLTPVRCSQFMTAKEDEYRFAVFVNRVFAAFARGYGRALAFSLEHRWKIVSGALGLFALSMLSVMWITKEFMPVQDIGVFIIRFQTPIGSSLTFTNNKAAQMEKILKANPSIAHYFVNVGGFDGGETNKGIAFISLKDRGERAESQQQIMDAVRDGIKKEIPAGFDAFMINPSGNFGGAKRGTSIELSVRGSDYGVLKEKVGEMTKRFAASGLMTDIDTDFRDGVTEVQVAPDPEKAAASGVNVQDIADTINTAIGGVRQGYFTNGIRRYDVRIRLLPEQWRTTSDIDRLLVRTSYGELIPLSSVTTVTEQKKLLTITREMRQRAINIYANAATGQSLDNVMEFARKTAKDVLPDGYTLAEIGASKDVIDAFISFIFTLVMGLLISYMVLAIQFNSFIHPVPVMIALPFSLTGAFLSLLLTHNSLNLYSFIGIVVLMGITLKNSILLVEFFNKQRREHGRPLREAILIGGPIRLRPIIMTSAATVAASIIPALGIGPGAEVRVSMAVVIIGGVCVSTLFSLLVVPCLYDIMAPIEDTSHYVRRELDAADAEEEKREPELVGH
ncbi:MAG TPA: efflux RND transporter permease subunit [Candidatus Methylacidiphilales bacterium]|jgi:HAE1 family hydrophobic/amphiphilic exporter-1|nr:efflux RND transporter permease subunit [Candidatus Methylacidiphilales bacterium]